MALPNVAYFSMEIAMDQSLSTYSGGLGFLAGSHMLSAGYLQMPMVGVTMLWSYGYYDQRINHTGNVEVAYIRKYYDFLTDINVQTEVDIFAGEIIRLGKLYGIATPYNQVLYDLIKIEEKRK
jgi:starch phosphorylase